jgi:hypothetical protein
MRRIAGCVDTCNVTVQAQTKCMQVYGPQRAPEMCANERHQAESCLGSCLEPDRRKALDDCVKTNRADSESCKVLSSRLIASREMEGLATLKAMGFAEGEIQREGVDTLMDVTGVLVMVSFFEEQQ